MKASGFLSITCGLIYAAQTITPLSGRADGLSSPALSPDGTMLAYNSVGPDYSIWIDVRPFTGGKVIHFAGWLDNAGPNSPRWSPDGKQIAFLRFYCHSCNHKLFVKDFPSGPEKPLGEVCGGTPSWTPDGQFLIATELAGKNAGWDPCRAVLIPVDGGASVRLAADGDELALTRDGKHLAYAAGNTVKMVHLDPNYRFADTPVEIAKEPHAISGLHWSGDGRTLVYQVWNYTKAVTDGVARLIHSGAPIDISQILADGSVLGTEEGGPTALWRFDLNSTPLEPERVRSIPWTDEDLSVSPDGQSLAFATARNGPTQIWISRMDGRNARVLISAIPPFNRYGDKTTVDGISWSPDGKLIAMETQPGIGHGVTDARLFIVPSVGGRLRKLVDCGSTGRAPIWTEDGKALYTVKYSEDYRSSYFLADIATGTVTPIGDEKVPRLPLVALPEGSGHAHVAQGGRFLYYEAPVDWKPRLVKVEGLIR
jgi:Tol biopolymer transport system component